MERSLSALRQRLSPQERPGRVRFTSVQLQPLEIGQGRPVTRAGASLTFRLGVNPAPPTEIRGHLYRDPGEDLLAELPAATERVSGDQLFCSFILPHRLPEARVCLIIEGRWGKQVAGCEMTFEVRS